MADTMSAARAMWSMVEPVHDVAYFAPAALRAFTEAGVRGYCRGYFAGRAAPLGDARAAVVAASFYNFAPAFVSRAIPGVWELIAPADAIAVREAGAAAALRPLLDGREAEAAKAADLLWRAAQDLDFAGRVLSAANSELPVSGDPLIGDDVWTGPYVYITDQNHAYEDPNMPVGRQVPVNRPVSIGAGCWLGAGAIILPGATRRTPQQPTRSAARHAQRHYVDKQQDRE